MQPHVIAAVVRKEFTGYFTNPAGYIFITLFVFLSGLALFWTPGFFDRNLANLDQLNGWFPVLLLFLIPAITMASWAEERRQGTEELLLTLPASETELAIGKYLGCVSIYSVCLLFALGHVVVLLFLGRPDLGLTASTFLAYFLAGSSLCAVGLAASSMASSATISYIGGALACFAFVGVGLLARAVPGGMIADAARAIELPARLEPMARGVIDLADVAYFVGVAVLGLVLAVAVIGSRRKPTGARAAARAVHWSLRGVALVAGLAFTVVLLDRSALRVDATAERLWSLSPQTRDLLAKWPQDRSALVTAYLSPTVPESLVQQRETLMGLLREVQSSSGGAVQVRMVETRANTEEAREAERNFGIKPRGLSAESAAVGGIVPVYMGVAVTGGGSGASEPSVIEFLGRGLNAEYELTRALRAVSASAKKKVGVLETAAGLLGQFDFQAMQNRPDWPIVADLRKQYQVVKVAPAAPFPMDLDVLIVAQPSTLSALELNNLIAYVEAGRPAIIIEDPFPFTNPALATAEPRRPASPFGGPPPEPKASLAPLWTALGASIAGDAIVWDPANPHPELSGVPPEFVFISRAAAGAALKAGVPPINDDDPITSGLQEVVMLLGGRIEQLPPPATAMAKDGEATASNPASTAAAPIFTTLLRSSQASGQIAYSSLMQRGPMGMGGFNPNRRPTQLAQPRVMAARLKGGANNLDVLLVSDLDMISEEFFRIRESGLAGLEFDNVTFILNAVDQLAGEESLLELRKRRRIFRTLERVEARRREETSVTQDAIRVAEADAESRLAQARTRFDGRIKEIEGRQDLDATTKQVMVESVRQAEQRRLDADTAAVEDQKRQRIEDARLATQSSLEQLQTSIRVAALTLPPVPALLMGLGVLIVRRRNVYSSVRRAEAGTD